MMHYDAIPMSAAMLGCVVILTELVLAGLAVDEPDVAASIRNWSNCGDRRSRHWQISPAYLRHGTVDVWRDAKAGDGGLLEPHAPERAGIEPRGTVRVWDCPAK